MVQKQVTIYDIAKEAGVSPSTVSRILANSTGVKPEKRQRVMALVEKYQFRPNALAKGLSRSRSKIFGMLCPDVRNPFYANMFAACEQAAYKAGYMLLVNNTFGMPDKEIAFMQRMVEQRVDSLIICGGVVDWCPLPGNFLKTLQWCSQQLPVVVVGEVEDVDCCQIHLDYEGGMRQAIRHLVSLGHKKIAFLHSHPYIRQTITKKQVYVQTMQELGLPVREEYVVYGGAFNEQDGYQGMNRLLALPEPPTAVVATNDMMCVGAMQAINSLGYSVPGDFSLIGFDDVYLTELTQPNLSSIRLDYESCGNMMIGAAIDAMESISMRNVVDVPLSLTIRASCRKI